MHAGYPLRRSGGNEVILEKLTGRERCVFARDLAVEDVMLNWAITFLIVALIAAVLGFGGIAGVAIELAKIVFFVAIVLFVISAIFGLMGRRAPPI